MTKEQSAFQEMLISQIGVTPQEYRYLQIAIAMPQALNRSETSPLRLFVQNPYDIRIRYAVSLKQYPEPMSTLHAPDVQVPKVVKHRLNPGESGLLEIPMWVKKNARVGRHAYDLSVYNANDEANFFGGGKSGTRIYPRAAPTEVKRGDNLAAKNLIGLGLAATIGLGFVSFPTGGTFFRLTYMVVAHEGQEQKPKQLVPQYRSFWTPSNTSKFNPQG